MLKLNVSVLKTIEIIDINNGFLFCPNHDKVFDRFLISFNSRGSLLYSKKIENFIEDIYNTSKNSIKTKVFIYVKNEMNKYLDFHRNEFDKKWNE